MDKPLEYEFAKDGDRNTNLPNANADDNSVSFQSGFTLPYELNPANGGKNIERSDMNEIFYRICKAINDTAEQVGAWNALTTENLNDVKQRGYYYQPLNIEATSERNYPANTAGYLIVFNNSINSWGVTQFYKVYNSDRVFIRRTTSATAWSTWDSFVLTSEYNAKVTQLQNSINTKEDKTKFTNSVINSSTNSDLNNLTTNGFFWRTPNQGAPLPTTNGGAVIVDTNGSQITQYFYTDVWNSATGGIWFRTRNARGTWTDWQHVENSEHAEATYRKIADSYTKTETNNLLNQKEDKTKISTQDLTTENLNNITNQGYFRQQTNANATTARNYPVQQAGTLINLIPSESGSIYLKQVYLTINNDFIFVRARNNDLNWTNWGRLALKSEVDLKRNISDSYSKTETNTQINNAVNSTTHRYKALRCNPSANTIQWQTGGISISKQNDYTVRITHNLGTTNYAVTASINRIGRPLGASSANVVAINANYCDISCHWGGDNAQGNILPTIMNVSIFY